VDVSVWKFGFVCQATCQYEVAVPGDVCQLRLDFDTFLLAGPTDNTQVSGSLDNNTQVYRLF
jgi:hypothetical protein